MRNSRAGALQLVIASNVSTMDMKNLMGHLQRSSRQCFFLTGVIDASKIRAMSTIDVGNTFI